MRGFPATRNMHVSSIGSGIGTLLAALHCCWQGTKNRGIIVKQSGKRPFKLIGQRLRSDGREIETALLPAGITMLLEQLKRREAEM